MSDESKRQGRRPTKQWRGESGLLGRLPFVLMAYVILLMVLPLFEMECGDVTVEWTGTDLFGGSTGHVSGAVPGTDSEGVDLGPRVGEIPHEYAVAAIPALAFLAIVALSLRARGLTAILLALLLAVFAWFTWVGFRIEREVADALGPVMGHLATESDLGPFSGWIDEPAIGRMGRTIWFWIGFGATGLALLLVGITGRARRASRGG